MEPRGYNEEGWGENKKKGEIKKDQHLFQVTLYTEQERSTMPVLRVTSWFMKFQIGD